jgi:photosystem II stability/assembly factor-like uncharacterized protein
VAALENLGPDVFAGFSNGGGGAISRDGGRTWQAFAGTLAQASITGLARGGGMVYVLASNGLYRSADRGATWDQIPYAFYSTQSVAANDQAVFVGTSSGFYRSLDNGATWSTGSNPKSSGFDCLAVMGRYVFAGLSTGGVYRSSDNGGTWTASNQGISTTPIVRQLRVAGDTLEFGSTGNGMYRSLDSGNTWTLVATGTMLPMLKRNGVFYACQANTVYGKGAYKSLDDGKTWARIWPNLQDDQIRHIAGQGEVLVAGCNGGLYASKDGGESWTRVDVGQKNSNVTSLTGQGKSLVASSYGGIFVSGDGGSTWQERNTGLGIAWTLHVESVGDALYAGLWRGGLYKSDNLGLSWSRVPVGSDSGNAFTAVSLGGTVYAGTDNGVYLSADGGKTWTDSTSPDRAHTAYCLAAVGNEILLGTGFNGVWRLTDDSVWSNSSGGVLDRYDVRDLFVGDGFVLAATQGWGIWRSTDQGRNWQKVGSEALPGEVWSFLAAPGRLFACGGKGVAQSLDGGLTWYLKNEGLPQARAMGLAFLDNNLYVGLDGYGVWKRPLEDISLALRAPTPRNRKQRPAWDPSVPTLTFQGNLPGSGPFRIDAEGRTRGRPASAPPSRAIALPR